MSNIKMAADAFRAGNTQEAESLCRDLIRFAPRDPKAFVLLGMVLANTGRILEGVEALRTASRLNPKEFPIQANLALLLGRAGLLQEARSAYRAAIALAPRNVEIRLSYARLLADSGDQTVAITVLRECLEIDGNFAEALTMLGFQLQSLGQFEEARALLERSLGVDPKQGIAYAAIALGQKLCEEDTWLLDRLEAVLEKGLLFGGDRAYLHFAIGKANEDLGRFEEAMKHFDVGNRIAYEFFEATRLFRTERYGESLRTLASLFSRETLASPVGIAGKPKPIFVLGTIRSGTTLVEQILSSHPDVSGAGELEFWMRNGAEAVRSSGGKILPAQVEKLRRDYLAAIGARANGAPWVTDKMPQNYQWIGLIHLAFPDAPIIHLVRDDLDTCLSIWTTIFERPPDFVHDKANIMYMIEEHRKLMEYWRSALPPGRILDVRYEDLVSDTETSARKMLAYCGLTWNDACLRHDKNPRAVHTASYWQARQPVYTSSVARWRRFKPWLGEFSALMPEDEVE